MPRKYKPAETEDAKSLPSVAAMKFWARLKNPPPMLAFAFPEESGDEDETESFDQLLQLPAVPFDDSLVYTLRISLEGSKPQVWRRIQVKSLSLEYLHSMIQTCMGWEDFHLHVFEVRKNQVPYVGEGAPIDERQISINQLHAAKIPQFDYTYDFGDDWRHTITIEKVSPAQPQLAYPFCVAGKGACPREDCGGIERWSRLLKSLRYPQRQRDVDIEELLERLGRDYTPPLFDLEQTNKRLQREFNKRPRRKGR
jgi:hypothetical protein